MGLDCWALNNLTLDPNIRVALTANGEQMDMGSFLSDEDDVMEFLSGGGLVVYPSEFQRQLEGLEVGCGYTTYNCDKTHSWRAGSYSGYGEFRNFLAELSGLTCEQIWKAPNDHPNLPFLDLIDFSDCEGVIGPVACARLNKDFVQFRDMIFSDDADRRFRFDEGDLWRVWADWEKATEIGSENGCIVFG